MKYMLPYLKLLVLFTFFSNFLSAQEKLSPKKFKLKLLKDSNSMLLDVRTPREVSKSYIKDAVFMDFHDSLFKEKLTTIDKSKTIYVYCAIGVRSHDAAVMLRENGIKEVYDLSGGIINWKLAGLPVEKGKDYDSRKGISKEDFISSIKDKPLALVDFYAPWCAPCQVMVPALDSITISMKDSVNIVKINADENLELMKALHFNNLPYIMVYKNGVAVFRQDGFMSREQMENLIRKYY